MSRGTCSQSSHGWRGGCGAINKEARGGQATTRGGRDTPVYGRGTHVAGRGIPVAGRGTSVAVRGTTGGGRGTPVAGRGTSVAGRGTSVAGRGTTGGGRGTPVAGRGTLVAGRGTSVAGRGQTGGGRGTSRGGQNPIRGSNPPAQNQTISESQVNNYSAAMENEVFTLDDNNEDFFPNLDNYCDGAETEYADPNEVEQEGTVIFLVLLL